jgi:DNA-binding NtrC family response regulator
MMKNNPTGIIIDDEKDIVDNLSTYLELKGHDIVGIGYNGCNAATLYSEKNPDYVILDMKMPQYDGMYAIQKIKEKDQNAKIFVITGHSEYDIENLVTKVISKPFTLDKIERIIKNTFTS